MRLFWLHFTISVLYCLCGYAGFITFLILANYPAGVLGLIAGFSCSILCFLHILQYRGSLQIWYHSDSLLQICRLGFSLFSISILFLVYHLVMEILLQKDIFPISNSSVIAIIFSIIAIKSAFLLMYFALFYEKQITEPILVQNAISEEDQLEQAQEGRLIEP